MTRKLNLAKMRAGQTIYFIDTNIRSCREWTNFVRSAVVDNSPIPSEAENPFFDGKISRHFLKSIHPNYDGWRGFVFRSRGKAKKACDYLNLQLNKDRNVEKIED